MQTSNVQTGTFTTFLNEDGIDNDTTILLLHGSGPGANAMSNWQFALPYLADSYHCLAPDIAGFGQSQHNDHPRGTANWIDTWVQQQVDLLDAKGLDKVHLIGNSMGGGVTLHLLDRHPDRFDKALLMGPVGAPFAPTEGLTKGWEFYKNASEEVLLDLIKKFLYDPSILGPDVDKIAAERYINVMKDNVKVQFEAMFCDGTKSGIDAFVLPEERLAKIQHKMMVTHAREDYFIPLSNSYHLIDHIPNAQLHVFHHCGHWVQIEQKNAFNHLAKQFFDGAFD